MLEETSHDQLSRKRCSLTPSQTGSVPRGRDSLVVMKSDTADLLEEATMSLAGAAMYRQDTTKALLLYDKVKTPHAAFNQSKVNAMCVEVTVTITGQYPFFH